MCKTPRLLLSATILTALTGLSAGEAIGRNFTNYSGGGARIGIADVDHVGTTFTIGAFMDIGVAPNVVINSAVDYWQDSDESGGVTLTVRDIAFSGFARYAFSNGRRSGIVPFAGGGLALHLIKAEVKYHSGLLGKSHYSDSESEIGMDFGGGILIDPDMDTSYIAEARYRSVDDDVDVDHLVLSFGIIKVLE